jgi:hypothetical protein
MEQGGTQMTKRIFEVINKNSRYFGYEGELVIENEHDLRLKVHDVGGWESQLIFDKTEVEEKEIILNKDEPKLSISVSVRDTELFKQLVEYLQAAIEILRDYELSNEHLIKLNNISGDVFELTNNQNTN